MLRICVTAMACLMTLPNFLSAQQMGQGPLTLKESVEIGLQNNRTLKNALLDEEKAGYQRKEIIGSGLPQVNVSGGYNNFINVFPQALPGGFFGDSEPGSVDVIAFGVPQSLKVGASVNQLLFSSSYLVGLKAAKTSEQFYRLLSQQTEEDVIYDISMNYLGTLQLELQKENLQANIDQLTGLEKVLRSQVENDMVRKVDLNRVIVNLSTLETELENLEIGIAQRKNYLKLLMGIPMDSNVELDDALLEDPRMKDVFQVGDLNPENRMDIQVLDKQRSLLDLEYKNIKASRHPSLVAFGDINRNAFSNQFDFLTDSKVWYQGFLIGLKLDVPIFDGFSTKYRASQNKVSQRQLQQNRHMAWDAAEMEYENASKKYFNSLKTLDAVAENLLLADEVLKETSLLYKESLSPLTDLLDAESTQRQARASFNNQLVQVQIARIELLKSTGNIRHLLQ